MGGSVHDQIAVRQKQSGKEVLAMLERFVRLNCVLVRIKRCWFVGYKDKFWTWREAGAGGAEEELDKVNSIRAKQVTYWMSENREPIELKGVIEHFHKNSSQLGGSIRRLRLDDTISSHHKPVPCLVSPECHAAIAKHPTTDCRC